ncbi:MAG: DUF2515 family protein [Nocardioidaceae bacterium]
MTTDVPRQAGRRRQWRAARASALSAYGLRPTGIRLDHYLGPRAHRRAANRVVKTSGQIVDLIGPDGLVAKPHQFVPRNSAPSTIAEWKTVADDLLTNHCCAFHRNMEISARYAWMYKLQPACFKWAAMAALASHHVRLALFPLRLDTDGSGYVDIPHSVGRPRLLLMEDVNTIRATNNAIFDDIFWVHLAYVTAEAGLERVRALLQADRDYAPVLSGFEAIDRGRQVLEDTTASAEARQTAADLIWQGNVTLLEHEQRALVQPNFDRLSCAFARLVSIGATTSFEVSGVRPAVAYFTSFYVHSITRGIQHSPRAPAWPRITRFDDRWRWLVSSVVPRFRRLDADPRLIDASMRRIFDEARDYASTPCVLPLSPAGEASALNASARQLDSG